MQKVIKKRVSVVIPTLGGECLNKTVEILNSGTVIPAEILICIPEKHSHNVNNLDYHNIKILKTKVSGQVSQRAEGFRAACHDYVMQLDDDIIVEKKCLENMLGVLASRDGKYAVSPSLKFVETDKSVYEQWRNRWSRYIYILFINGGQWDSQGFVTKAGTEVGIFPDLNIVYNTEWLPGGCILHLRENLEMSNFYPFIGKAFCEDLYHSLILKNKGVNMIIDGNSVAWIDDPRTEKKIIMKEWWYNLLRDWRARNYYVKMTGRSIFRMNIYYLIVILGYFKRRFHNFYAEFK